MSNKKNDDRSLITIVKNSHAIAKEGRDIAIEGRDIAIEGRDIAIEGRDIAIENRDAINENRKAIKGNRKAIEKNGKKISSLDTTLTELTALVIENKMDIKEIKETIMTKEDKDEILSVISEFTGRTQSNEEQITIGTHQLVRTNKRVDKAESDIRQIKPLVGIK